MLIQDIPKIFIGDNVFLPYWEGSLTDDGARPCETKKAFDFESVKKYVEEGSKNWFGSMELRFIPLYPVKDGEESPTSLTFHYNGTTNRWTDYKNNDIDFNAVMEELK